MHTARRAAPSVPVCGDYYVHFFGDAIQHFRSCRPAGVALVDGDAATKFKALH